MEWWLWLIIIASILVVGVILYMVLAGGDEEEAVEEEKVAEMEEVINLNDKKTLEGLYKDGIQLTVGETQYWSVSEPEVKGYSWIFNDECKPFMNTEILEGPPMKKEKAEGEEKEAKEEEGDAEKEEKRLRDGHKKKEIADKMAAGDIVYLAVTGEKAGSCAFAATYNESWDWSVDAEEQDPDARFFKFDLTVFEAAEEGDDKKAEEKAE